MNMAAMMAPYEIRVVFWLSGVAVAPEAISAHLGLEADHVVRAGQAFPAPRDPAERANADFWGVSPELDLPAPRPAALLLDELLQPVRTLLSPCTDRLATLPACAAKMSLCIVAAGAAPRIVMGPGDFDFLWRAGIDCALEIRRFASTPAPASMGSGLRAPSPVGRRPLVSA
jgi:hypothetical protein